MARVADQSRSAKQLFEYALGEDERLFEGHSIQAQREIGPLMALDDEGAHGVFVRIDVGLEPAVFGALEGLDEGVVGAVGAEPHVAAPSQSQVRYKVLRIPG